MTVANSLTLRGSLTIRLKQKLKRVLRYEFNFPQRLKLRHEWLTLRGSVARSRCFVIAGGPSFTESMAQAIIDNRFKYDVIAMNYFSESPFSRYIKPDIYVLSDPVHLCPSSHPLAPLNKRLKSYISEYSPVVVVPNGREWKDFSDCIVPFNDLEDLSSSNISPIYPRGYTSNTAFKAIAVALFLGYEKIVLSGFDHTYASDTYLDSNGKLFLRSRHHYDHDYEDRSIGHLFESSAHAIHCWALNLYAIRHFASNRIVNVTDRTLVDTFATMSISEFLAEIN